MELLSSEIELVSLRIEALSSEIETDPSAIATPYPVPQDDILEKFNVRWCSEA
jgi:hypothetical protein